jgi:hypothetical protein
MKVCPSRPSSNEYYAHGEIMLRKTNVSYNEQLCCLVLDSQHLRTSDQHWRPPPVNSFPQPSASIHLRHAAEEGNGARGCLAATGHKSGRTFLVRG